MVHLNYLIGYLIQGQTLCPEPVLPSAGFTREPHLQMVGESVRIIFADVAVRHLSQKLAGVTCIGGDDRYLAG